jgi:hypothetical protein
MLGKKLIVFSVLFAAYTLFAEKTFSEPAFIMLLPDKSSFWHTATGATIEVSVDMPLGAKRASLSVSAPGYQRCYEDIPEGWFSFSVCEPSSPDAENVYDLTLSFDDGTVQFSRIGVVQGVGRVSASARCILDEECRQWEKVYNRAVVPIPYGTQSLSVGDKKITDFGLDRSQGWYPVAGFSAGVRKSVELSVGESRYSADLLGGSLGFLMFIK